MQKVNENYMKCQYFNLFQKSKIQKQSAQLFSCEFCKFSKNTFFYRTPVVTASEHLVKSAPKDLHATSSIFHFYFMKFSSKLLNAHWKKFSEKIGKEIN